MNYNCPLPSSPQRPRTKQRAGATLRVFCRASPAASAALAAVLTPSHASTAKRDDFTAAMHGQYGPAIESTDRPAQLGDKFDGAVVGDGNTPIAISVAAPDERYGPRVTTMAGSCLPASPTVATLWLYAEWSDMGRAPDKDLEGAYVSYFHHLFDRRVTPFPRAKQRRLALDPIKE